MKVERIAAFADGKVGGNPAGVVICDTLPDAPAMQGLASEIGYSETVFAAPSEQGWRVRYFAPEVEVDFCGHATIALGAALALRCGDGTFRTPNQQRGDHRRRLASRFDHNCCPPITTDPQQAGIEPAGGRSVELVLLLAC